ncbi:NlpC/P60 family protein [Desulfitobacterium sp.]|uniref:C40 family peptidase n=1 Tax=Desulfitobacterium sp. TaxID=49981 RepID=UPI002C58EF75|nr:NlpC/P60 family protein [Desulfitobacterium sp.]HVJ49018.1 NlpC/P60 family protein [Desulfitobacterium sp.]
MKKIFTTILCLSLMGTTLQVQPVNASNLQDQLQQYQSQYNQLSSQLSGQKQQVSSASTQAAALQQSIQTLNDSVVAYQKELTAEQKNLKALESKQKELETERQNHIQALGQYMRTSYEEGAPSYLQVLFQATNLTDFLARIEDVSAVVNTYGKLQQELGQINEDLSTQQAQIKEKNDSLQNILQAKAQSQKTVQEALNKQKTLVSQLSSNEKSTYQATLNAKSNADRVQQLIAQQELEARLAAQKPISDGGTSSGESAPVAISGGAGAILSYASQFLGTPYVWGGTSPSGFDCSGFTQYVFRQAGIDLSRTSQSQYNQGTSVARSNLKAGDLVFFSTYGSGATHVGIYAGNNTMIDSSNGGVTYENMNNSYWDPRYLGARRLISE